MRLRFRGGIYSSPEFCGCGGCPGGYGIRPYGLWDAFIHPMGACCDGNGHGLSGDADLCGVAACLSTGL